MNNSVAGQRAARRRSRNARLFNALGLTIAAAMFFPVYWMVSTAFKQTPNILSVVPRWVPFNPTLSHFVEAFTRDHFWSSVRNTIIVVGAAVLFASTLALFGAIAVARFRFRGRKLFLFSVITVQMVPLTAMVIPLYLLLSSVNQTDKLTGIIIIYAAWTLPFTLWTLRGFVVNVPEQLEESAMVDGCTRIGAFRRILLPLVAPGLVATSIYSVITLFNELVIAYVVLGPPEKHTLTLWLGNFSTQRGTEWGPLMAASTLVAIPIIIFFFMVQRKVAAGLTAGAIKG